MPACRLPDSSMYRWSPELIMLKTTCNLHKSEHSGFRWTLRQIKVSKYPSVSQVAVETLNNKKLNNETLNNKTQLWLSDYFFCALIYLIVIFYNIGRKYMIYCWVQQQCIMMIICTSMVLFIFYQFQKAELWVLFLYQLFRITNATDLVDVSTKSLFLRRCIILWTRLFQALLMTLALL